MPGFNPLSISAPSPVGRGGASAAQLIQRVYFGGSFIMGTGVLSGTVLVPKGATVARIKAVGGGAPGWGGQAYPGGGGGAYAFTRLSGLSAGVSLSYSVASSMAPIYQGGELVPDTTVSFAGQVVCRAKGAAGNGGGVAAQCIGDVVRSGGNGGTGGGGANTATAGLFGGAAGAFQYPGNTNNGGAGGGAAGDRDESGHLNLGGDGAMAPGNAGGIPAPGYGGGGSGGNNVAQGAGAGSPGLVVFEFWSA